MQEHLILPTPLLRECQKAQQVIIFSDAETHFSPKYMVGLFHIFLDKNCLKRNKRFDPFCWNTDNPKTAKRAFFTNIFRFSNSFPFFPSTLPASVLLRNSKTAFSFDGKNTSRKKLMIFYCFGFRKSWEGQKNPITSRDLRIENHNSPKMPA